MQPKQPAKPACTSAPMSMTTIDQLKKQLEDDWKQNLSPDNSDVLAGTLSQQLQYNSTLLAQVDALEQNYSFAQQHIRIQENELSRSHAIVADLEQKLSNTEHKLLVASRMCEQLSEQCASLREDATSVNNDANQLKISNDAQQQRMRRTDSEKHKFQQRMSELESTVQLLQSSQSESTTELISKHERLSELSEICRKELAASQQQCAKLEIQLREAKNEIIDLHRKHDILLQQVQDESIIREDLVDQGRKLSAANSALTKKYFDAAVRCDELSEANLKYRQEASDFEESQHTTSQVLEETVGRSRQLEEYCKHQESIQHDHQAHSQSLQIALDLAHCKLTVLQQQLAQYEHALHDNTDKSLKVARDRIAEQSAQLSQLSQQSRAERDSHDQLTSQLTAQLETLAADMTSLRQAHAEQLLQMTEDKDLLQVKLSKMEGVMKFQQSSQLSVENRKATTEDQLRLRITELQDELCTRGDRYIGTLNGLQRVIQQLTESARSQRDSYSFIAAKQQQLRAILHQLLTTPQGAHDRDTTSFSTTSFSASGRSAKEDGEDDHDNNDDDDRDRGRAHQHFTSQRQAIAQTPPALRALAQYGHDLKHVLHSLIDKVAAEQARATQLQQGLTESEEAGAVTESSNIELQAQVHAAEQQLVNMRTNLAVQEQQQQEQETVIGDCNQQLMSLRRDSAGRAAKLEHRLSALTQQLVHSQSEVARISTEMVTVRSVCEGKIQDHVSRLQQSDTLAACTLAELKTARAQLAACQSELVAAESKQVKLQTDHQQLRQLHQTQGELSTTETRKLKQQIVVLRDTLLKYQTQLGQTQQLILTVQTHKHELQSEVDQYRHDQTISPHHHHQQQQVGVSYSRRFSSNNDNFANFAPQSSSFHHQNYHELKSVTEPAGGPTLITPARPSSFSSSRPLSSQLSTSTTTTRPFLIPSTDHNSIINNNFTPGPVRGGGTVRSVPLPLYREAEPCSSSCGMDLSLELVNADMKFLAATISASSSSSSSSAGRSAASAGGGGKFIAGPRKSSDSRTGSYTFEPNEGERNNAFDAGDGWRRASATDQTDLQHMKVNELSQQQSLPLDNRVVDDDDDDEDTDNIDHDSLSEQ